MEKRYAERRTMWLWMLWKRKLFVQYWTRFESTRDDWLKREKVKGIEWASKRTKRTKAEAFSTLQTIQNIFTDYPILALIWCRTVLSLSLSVHVCAQDAFVFVCECACVCAWIRVQHGSHLNNNLNWIYIFKLNIKRKVHYHLHNPPLRMCFYWVNNFTYSIVKERCRLPNFTVICAINSTDLQWVSFLFITHGVCQ